MPAAKKPTLQQIAKSFTDQYYTHLSQNRDKLHNFYNVNSHFLHQKGNSESEEEVAVGKEMIKAILTSGVAGAYLFSRGQHVEVALGTVDAHHSGADGGVMLLVTGTLKTEGAAFTFTQSFYLAQHQDNKKASYFVLNDTMRVGAPLSTTQQATSSAVAAVMSLAAAPVVSLKLPALLVHSPPTHLPTFQPSTSLYLPAPLSFCEKTQL